jgi:tetratricopeptide (TPR) repeat protein
MMVMKAAPAILFMMLVCACPNLASAQPSVGPGRWIDSCWSPVTGQGPCRPNPWELPPPPSPVDAAKQRAAEADERGLQAMARHDLDAAIEAFRAAKQDDPDEASYQRNLQRALTAQREDGEIAAAQACMRQGNLGCAREHIEAAIKLNPDNQEMLSELNRREEQQAARARTTDLLNRLRQIQAQNALQAAEIARAQALARQQLNKLPRQTIKIGEALHQLDDMRPGSDTQKKIFEGLSQIPLAGMQRPNAAEFADLGRLFAEIEELKANLQAATSETARTQIRNSMADVKAKIDKTIDLSFHPPAMAPQ